MRAYVLSCINCVERSSEYGEGYVSESPVKLLDRLMHGVKKLDAEEVVVLSQARSCPLACRETVSVPLWLDTCVHLYGCMPAKRCCGR